MARDVLRVSDRSASAPGYAREVELPITRLVTGAEITLPVRVVHGREDGPTVWVTAAIHGDEVVGIEVIRRVVARLNPKAFRGTLVAVPIVNVFGFTSGDRYLPDRRDLNRSFPGSARGSLASRIAHLVMTEVVGRGARSGSTCTPAPSVGPTTRRSAPTSTTRGPVSWPRRSQRR